MGNIFVFGAGASKYAGFALSENLFPAIIKAIEEKQKTLKSSFFFAEELERVLNRLKLICPTFDKNIPSTFPTLEEYLSLCFTMQNFSSIKSSLYLEKGIDDDLLRILTWYFWHSMTNLHTPVNYHDLFFKKYYKPKDLLISFNYDWLLEEELSKFSSGQGYYLHPISGKERLVLKPHGSGRWIENTTEQELMDLYGVKSLAQRKFTLIDSDGLLWELYEWNPKVQEKKFIAGIIPPVWFKGFNVIEQKSFDFFIDCWKRILIELEDAEKVYIIGFSFAQADFLGRMIFQWGLRTKGTDQVIFVNPSQDHFDSFKKIVPVAKHEKLTFEDFVK